MSLTKRRSGRKTHTKQRTLTGTKSTSQSFVFYPAGVESEYQYRYHNGTIAFDEVRSTLPTQFTWMDTMDQSTSPKYMMYNYTDESGLPRKIEYPAFKWCQHSHAKHTYKPGRSVTFFCPAWRDRAPAIYETTFGRFVDVGRTHLPQSVSDLVKLGVAVSPSKILAEVESLSYQKLASVLKDDAMMLNFRDGFSILTFLAELTDLADLPKLLKKWTKTSRDVSDKYLGVQFGVLPFANDLKAIFLRLTTLNSQLDAWDAMAQDGQVRNYHFNLKEVADRLGISTKVYSESINRSYGYRPDWYPPKDYFRVECKQEITCKVHVYIAPLVIDPANLNAIKQHIWGAEDFLSTAWEKVPFSFVVDWFTGLGKVISSWHESPSYLQYKILSAGFSVRCVTKWKTTQGTSEGSSEHGTHEGEVVDFYRQPIPTTAAFTEAKASLNFKLLTEKQATLGAALLHQSIKR